MHLDKQPTPFSPAFRELFRTVRELAANKVLPDNDDSLEWHLAHPLWNLGYMQTPTGLNSVASGVRSEGGEPWEWQANILAPPERTISIGHLDIMDIDNECDEMPKAYCSNELTIKGQVLQYGEPFYDPDWDKKPKSQVITRILDECEIKRLNAHVQRW